MGTTKTNAGSANAVAAIALGGLVLVYSWSLGGIVRLDGVTLATSAMLLAGVIAAELFPIHLRQNTKLTVTTVPLFLMAALLPPPLAALAAGIAMLGARILRQSQTGITLFDIGMTTGRWIINVWLTALVAGACTELTHLPIVGLGVAALTMFTVELVGSALEIAPVSGESPQYLVRVLLREGGIAEGVQYIIGIGGALIAMEHFWTILLLVLPLGLVYLGLKRAKEMQDSTRRVLEDLADAIDLRDPYTGGHSRRVYEFSKQLLQAMSIVGMEAELILSAARVHDIGKIRLPDEILLKPGKLTPAEYKQIQAHAEIGAQILERYHDFARGRDIVLHHHERWDGAGYPAGLQQIEIPLGARIIAVIDSFDAMTSDRPYRRAFTTEHALNILREGRGTQWDPRIVDAFLALHALPLPTPTEAAHLDLIRA